MARPKGWGGIGRGWEGISKMIQMDDCPVKFTVLCGWQNSLAWPVGSAAARLAATGGTAASDAGNPGGWCLGYPSAAARSPPGCATMTRVPDLTPQLRNENRAAGGVVDLTEEPAALAIGQPKSW
jgi:hypothetical protein